MQAKSAHDAIGAALSKVRDKARSLSIARAGSYHRERTRAIPEIHVKCVYIVRIDFVAHALDKLTEKSDTSVKLLGFLIPEPTASPMALLMRLCTCRISSSFQYFHVESHTTPNATCALRGYALGESLG